MKPVSFILHGLLVGASGYGFYAMPPNTMPYGFVACSFGFCHGLIGMINSFECGDEEGEESAPNKVYEVSRSCMEIIPLPLFNIEYYIKSSTSNIALGHGLFIIPLAFELIAKLFADEDEDTTTTDTLKDLTVLGNIVSLVFLAINEEKYLLLGVAGAAFFARYGAMLSEYLCEGTGEYAWCIGNAVLCGLGAYAASEGGEG